MAIPWHVTRELLASLTFRPFNKDEFSKHAVKSPVPLISVNPYYTVIIDGNRAEIIDDYDIFGTCEDICKLPHKSEKQIRIEAELQALKQSVAALELELQQVS